FLTIPRLPRSTLFPYTTLFRSLLLLIGSLYYLDTLFPYLFRGLDYIPISAVFFGVFFLYSLLKKFIQTFGSQGNTNGGKQKRPLDRKSTRLNSSHVKISYAVFC